MRSLLDQHLGAMCSVHYTVLLDHHLGVLCNAQLY